MLGAWHNCPQHWLLFISQHRSFHIRRYTYAGAVQFHCQSICVRPVKPNLSREVKGNDMLEVYWFKGFRSTLTKRPTAARKSSEHGKNKKPEDNKANVFWIEAGMALYVNSKSTSRKKKTFLRYLVCLSLVCYPGRPNILDSFHIKIPPWVVKKIYFTCANSVSWCCWKNNSTNDLLEKNSKVNNNNN